MAITRLQLLYPPASNQLAICHLLPSVSTRDFIIYRDPVAFSSICLFKKVTETIHVCTILPKTAQYHSVILRTSIKRVSF